MNQKLADKLYKKYPKIFAQRHLDCSLTAMCWGFQCDDGWYDLIDSLCDWISWHVENSPHRYPDIQFSTVKEKFGGLRIYFDSIEMTEEEWKRETGGELIGGYKQYLKCCKSGFNEIRGVVSFTESQSYKICEHCGAPGKKRKGYWIHTYCDKCESEYLKEGK